MSKSSRRSTASRHALSQPAAGRGARSSRRPLLLWVVALAGAAGLGGVAITRAGGPADVTSPAAADLDADTIVFDREEIDLGRVPLEKVVPVIARLTNHSRRKVILAQATAQTLEGCWPPKPVVGATTLEPGQSTTVSFRTSMGPGMDGPHLFLISVPTTHPKAPRAEFLVRALFS